MEKNSFNLSSKHWWPPSQVEAEEFMAYSEKTNELKSLTQFDKVSNCCASITTGNESGPTLAKFLRERIASKTPTSMIRLGDADGNVLFSQLGEYKNLSEYCLKKISQIYFGDQGVMTKNTDFFAQIVIEAIKNADVIGAPERGTISRSFNTPIDELDTRGMCGMRGVYNFMAEKYDCQSLSKTIWGSTWFSRALLPFYIDIIKNQPYLGLITCYPELANIFKEKGNIGTVDSIIVPMQASIAKVNKNINHYPDAYPKILDAIRPPHQGAIYIIAAGILSKPYGTVVKARGGIAIDVGSVADVWMGAKTRPGIIDNFVERWKLR